MLVVGPAFTALPGSSGQTSASLRMREINRLGWLGHANTAYNRVIQDRQGLMSRLTCVMPEPP